MQVMICHAEKKVKFSGGMTISVPVAMTRRLGQVDTDAGRVCAEPCPPLRSIHSMRRANQACGFQVLL